MFLKQYFYIFIIILAVLTILLSIFIPSLSEYGIISTYVPVNNNEPMSIDISSSKFTWPTPGYTYITSPFGARYSPITGEPSYHYGTDIGAPEGTTILAIFSGQVTNIGFMGANGYTVTVTNGNISASYSHVSPNFIVYTGQYVSQGTPVAVVGPLNVYGVPNNPYRDYNGNPTNRFNNWSPFTLKHKN